MVTLTRPTSITKTNTHDHFQVMGPTPEDGEGLPCNGNVVQYLKATCAADSRYCPVASPLYWISPHIGTIVLRYIYRGRLKNM